MAYSLILEPWLPVIRRYSGPCYIRPAQIVEKLKSDPVIAIDWPRADFRLASLEFLIGLLAVACPPTDRRDWSVRNNTPPEVAALDAAFSPLVDVFNIDGDGPRFMQDFEALVTEPNEVATLLIEAPGEQSIKKNADLLNKRGRVQKLSRAAAAMALFTLQTYAPAGGAGNRTGLRGGGPLTTLALPPGMPALWNILWANVLNGVPAPSADWPHIFPWLAKTRTSDNNRTVAPAHDGDLLAYWGTPRRIRLVFEAVSEQARCDLTGANDEVLVTGWLQRPNGANYRSEAFQHPLTPRYKPKPKEPLSLPVHPQPAGIGYRDFVGLLFNSSDGSAMPARCITTYTNERRPRGGEVWRILAAGYDMDNMKARGFMEAELPVFGGDDGPEQGQILGQFIDGADIAASLLRNAVRNALFSGGAKPDTGAGLFTALRSRFWAESADDFYDAAKRIALHEDQDAVARRFLAALRKLALELFDETAPITASDHPARVAGAMKILSLSLRGYGKVGVALFTAFNLPVPETSKKRKAA